MSRVHETIFVITSGKNIKVELWEISFFRWEVWFSYQVELTDQFTFGASTDHGCEEHARKRYNEYKEVLDKQIIGEFMTRRGMSVQIQREKDTYYALVANGVIKTYRLTQHSMTADDVVRYLCNAAQTPGL